MIKLLILENCIAAGAHAEAGAVLTVSAAEAHLLIGSHRATAHAERVAERVALLAGQVERAAEIVAALAAPAFETAEEPAIETAAAPAATESAAATPARTYRKRA